MTYLSSIFLIFLVIGSCSGEAHAQLEEELLRSIREFTHANHGFGFERQLLDQKNQLVSRSMIYWSLDGKTKKTEQSRSPEDQLYTSIKTGMLFSDEEGWVFTGQERLINTLKRPWGRPRKLSQSITFYDTNCASPVAMSTTACAEGYVLGKKLCDYFAECKIVVKEEVFENVRYSAVSGTHPEGPDVEILFGSENEIKFMFISSVAGDLARVGSIFKEKEYLPDDVTVECRVGPISYEFFEKRRLPVEIPMVVKSEGEEHESKIKYLKYKLLTKDLSTLITKDTFSHFSMPSEIDRIEVASTGEPNMRYEIVGGEIARIVDAGAVEAIGEIRNLGPSGSTVADLIGVLLGGISLVLFTGLLCFRSKFRS